MTYVLDSANVINAGVQGGLKSAAVAGGMEGGIGGLLGGFDPTTMLVSMALQALYDKTKSTPSKNAGFLTTKVPALSDNDYIPLDAFASGFQPYGYGRRTSTEDVKGVSDTYRAIDAALKAMSDDAGIPVDYSTNNPFQGYDEQGLGTGAFYGYAGEKGKPGTALDKQVAQYAKQWLSGALAPEDRLEIDSSSTLDTILDAARRAFEAKKIGGVLTDRGWVNADGELIGTPPLVPVGTGGGGSSAPVAGGSGEDWVYPNEGIIDEQAKVSRVHTNPDGSMVDIYDDGTSHWHVGDTGHTPPPLTETPPAPDTGEQQGTGVDLDWLPQFPTDGAGGDQVLETGGIGSGTGTGVGPGSGAGSGPGEGSGDTGDGMSDLLSLLAVQPGTVATPNPMAPLADIKYYYDIGGDSIFAPTEFEDLSQPHNAPYDSPKGYPQGELDRLMQYLRG